MMITFIIAFAIVWFIFELSTILTYGAPINKAGEALITNAKNDIVSLNPFDLSILNVGRGSIYISKPIFSVLFKYHVSNIGVVWGWSKLTKHIDSLFIEQYKKSL